MWSEGKLFSAYTSRSGKYTCFAAQVKAENWKTLAMIVPGAILVGDLSPVLRFKTGERKYEAELGDYIIVDYGKFIVVDKEIFEATYLP